MNAHVEVPYAVENFHRMIGFCLRSRKRAFDYRRWAMQEAASGHLDRYFRYREWADTAWADAKDALFRAKMIKERMQ